jgi:integrase
MASIHKHGSGYRAHYTDAAGKSKASPTRPTVAEVEAWVRTNGVGEPVTLAKLADLYEKAGPNRADIAISVRRTALAQEWIDPRKIKLAKLAAWVRSDEYRYTRGKALRLVLAWAVTEQLIELPPAIAAWRPKRPARRPAKSLLTDSQVDAIRRKAASYGERALAIIDYLLTYGARPITACRLTRADLDPVRAELVIESAKHSGGWRHAVRPGDVEAWTKLSEKPEDPLFPHWREPRPWRITDGSAQELINWYRNNIGRKIASLDGLDTIYSLKRRAVTTMWSAGIDVPTMATFTGHQHLGTLMEYGRTNPDVQRAALTKLGKRVVMRKLLPITKRKS